MANLENFSTDEHIIISHLIAVNALAEKLSEFVGMSSAEIKHDVSVYAGVAAKRMSNDDIQEILDKHRQYAAKSLSSLDKKN